ncbi:MAG TPA: HTH domain-containing protein, partial [Limnochordia bacterium]|nr:HTH domain-containing protein [Limnochordia bacterium]
LTCRLVPNRQLWVITMPRKLLTAQELAEKLSLSVDTIWRYTREKQILYVEIGKNTVRLLFKPELAAVAGLGWY